MRWPSMLRATWWMVAGSLGLVAKKIRSPGWSLSRGMWGPSCHWVSVVRVMEVPALAQAS
ncbi:hypothetical protein FHU30_002838 [Actinomadura rupiterrae]|nr:hypothetical protein [Actinomadura rupiterrae]